MTPGPGIEPGTHWWKASALATAPALLTCTNLLSSNNCAFGDDWHECRHSVIALRSFEDRRPSVTAVFPFDTSPSLLFYVLGKKN